MADLLTTGQIARAIGAPRPAVDYAIEKGGIQARARAGIIRLFSQDQVAAIEAVLSTIRQRKHHDVEVRS